MSITSLTCHYSQTFVFPLCRHFHAEQTFLQIPSSPEIRAWHWGKAGPTLTATSHLHKFLASLWQKCLIPYQTCTIFVPVHKYQVLLVQPNLGRPTKCSWLSPLSLPSCFAFISPLMFATHQPEPNQGHPQHLAQTRSWNQFRACHELRRDVRADFHWQGKYMNIMFQLKLLLDTYSCVSPG